MDAFNNIIEQITGFIWADWVLYVVLGVFLVDVLLRRVRFWPARTQRWGASSPSL